MLVLNDSNDLIASTHVVSKPPILLAVSSSVRIQDQYDTILVKDSLFICSLVLSIIDIATENNPLVLEMDLSRKVFTHRDIVAEEPFIVDLIVRWPCSFWSLYFCSPVEQRNQSCVCATGRDTRRGFEVKTEERFRMDTGCFFLMRHAKCSLAGTCGAQTERPSLQKQKLALVPSTGRILVPHVGLESRLWSSLVSFILCLT